MWLPVVCVICRYVPVKAVYREFCCVSLNNKDVKSTNKSLLTFIVLVSGRIFCSRSAMIDFWDWCCFVASNSWRFSLVFIHFSLFFRLCDLIKLIYWRIKQQFRTSSSESDRYFSQESLETKDRRTLELTFFTWTQTRPDGIILLLCVRLMCDRQLSVTVGCTCNRVLQPPSGQKETDAALKTPFHFIHLSHIRKSPHSSCFQAWTVS